MEYGVSSYGGVWVRTTVRDKVSPHTIFVNINDVFVAAFIVPPITREAALKVLGYVAIPDESFDWEIRGMKTCKGEYGRKKTYRRRPKI